MNSTKIYHTTLDYRTYIQKFAQIKPAEKQGKNPFSIATVVSSEKRLTR